MEVTVVTTAGMSEALLGMGLSHGVVSHEDFKRGVLDEDVARKLVRRAGILAGKDGGENKLLESAIAWVSIKAPRYWWQEADTYRHLSKQSESTMHTITTRELTQEDFVEDIYPSILSGLNMDIRVYNLPQDPKSKHFIFRMIKRNLPEGFLQTRLVRLDMMSLRNMYRQRRNHRLEEWQFLFAELQRQLPARLWEWVTAGTRFEVGPLGPLEQKYGEEDKSDGDRSN